MQYLFHKYTNILIQDVLFFPLMFVAKLRRESEWYPLPTFEHYSVFLIGPS
jgi:hypothetical protein